MHTVKIIRSECLNQRYDIKMIILVKRTTQEKQRERE